MKTIAIQPKSFQQRSARLIQFLLMGLILVTMVYSPAGRAEERAACDDCGIYESLCRGKAVHWYILDENGTVVRGNPKRLLQSSQTLEFFNSVKQKYPGKIYPKEICSDNPLA